MKKYEITEHQLNTMANFLGELPYKLVKEPMAIMHVVAHKQEMKPTEGISRAEVKETGDPNPPK